MHIVALIALFLMPVPSAMSFTTVRSCVRQAFRCKFERFSTVNVVNNDEHFMKLALRHAQHAAREIEVPIGAVIVGSDGTVLAASRNQVEVTKDATAHAEIAVMREAAQLQGTWRLSDCTLYSTLEPCAMCLAAMQSFRVSRLVYGARDVRLGACGSFVNLSDQKHPFHSINISGGLLAEKSEVLLKRFFQNRRVDNKIGTETGDAVYMDRGMPSALSSHDEINKVTRSLDCNQLKEKNQQYEQQHSSVV